MLLLCLLTLRYCLDKYCLLKDCSESTACTKLRVMKISSGWDKLTSFSLTQAVVESFVVHLLEMLLLSKSLQLLLCSGGTAPALCFSSFGQCLPQLAVMLVHQPVCPLSLLRNSVADYMMCHIPATVPTFIHFLTNPKFIEMSRNHS